MADREANRRRASLLKNIKILAHMSVMADVQLATQPFHYGLVLK